MDSTPPQPDLDWCHDAVQGVSRTFAVTVDVLDEPMSSQICLGYLLCRVADTVEDAGHIPPAAQVQLLEQYDAALDPERSATMAIFREEVDEWLPVPDNRSDDWRVVANAETVWATFREQTEPVRMALLPPVREMIDGMAMFIDRYADRGGLRIQDRAELDEYCYYAAGTVGILITNLLTRADISERRERILYNTAEEFGLLLQLVNVSKDVYDDFTEENNVYLPAAWLAEEGVEQEAVIAQRNRGAVAKVVRRTADHARSYLDDAGRYLESMPLVHGNTVAAWLVPYLLCVGTLREIDRRPADAVTDTGLKVSRDEVFAVIDAASEAGRDSVPELRQRIAQQPYHKIVQQ
jgi:farnesyl-diphosphate farnesyltransferase